MSTTTGFMQMAEMPAAAGARLRGCSTSYLWLDADAKQANPIFADVPGATSTHRHRRPWETS
jgi:hypothetical protein